MSSHGGSTRGLLGLQEIAAWVPNANQGDN
jgi:hypothetical protein